MKNDRREIVRSIVLILQIGIAMIAALVVGGILGYLLGKWLGMKWLILPGLFLGAVSGYQNVYRMVRRYTKTDKKPEKSGPTEEEKKRMAAEAEFQAWKEEKYGSKD